MTSLLAPVPPPLRHHLRLEDRPRAAVAPAGVVIKAGVIALVGSLIADYALAEIGRGIFSVPATFDKFNFGGYAVLTAIGVIAAVIGWPLTQRVTRAPRWLYLRAAAVVTVVLLIPDFWLLTQAGNPTGPVIVLMVMHIAIAVITYLSMTRLAGSSTATAPAA